MPKTLTITNIPDDVHLATVDALCARGNCQSTDAAERELFARGQLLTELGRMVAEHSRQTAQEQAAAIVATAEEQVAAVNAAAREVVVVDVTTQH